MARQVNRPVWKGICFLAGVSAAAVIGSTSGQSAYSEGTIWALHLTGSRVAVAADSRVIKLGVVKDNACKIIPLGHDAVFVYAGVSDDTFVDPVSKKSSFHSVFLDA